MAHLEEMLDVLPVIEFFFKHLVGDSWDDLLLLENPHEDAVQLPDYLSRLRRSFYSEQFEHCVSVNLVEHFADLASLNYFLLWFRCLYWRCHASRMGEHAQTRCWRQLAWPYAFDPLPMLLLLR